MSHAHTNAHSVYVLAQHQLPTASVYLCDIRFSARLLIDVCACVQQVYMEVQMHIRIVCEEYAIIHNLGIYIYVYFYICVLCVCVCVHNKIAGENRLVCVRKNCERIFRGLD